MVETLKTPTRSQMVRLALVRGPLCVRQIAARCGLSVRDANDAVGGLRSPGSRHVTPAGWIFLAGRPHRTYALNNAGRTQVRNPRRSVGTYLEQPGTLAEFERLIRDTELSISECARRAGIHPASATTGGQNNLRRLVSRHRDYVDNVHWYDRSGNLHPAECGTACAAEKAGLSVKTVQRRIREGLVVPKPSKTGRPMHRFDPADVVTLARKGRKLSGAEQGLFAKVTAEDVRAIRQAKAGGISSKKLAVRYGVTVRQINRICARQRWRDV